MCTNSPVNLSTDRSEADVSRSPTDNESSPGSFIDTSGQQHPVHVSTSVRPVPLPTDDRIGSSPPPNHLSLPGNLSGDDPDDVPPLRNGRVQLKAGGSTGKAAVAGGIGIPASVAVGAAIAGAALHLGAGAVIGQLAIPIPGVGAVVGVVATGILLAIGGGSLTAGIDKLRGGRSQQQHLNDAVQDLVSRGHDLTNEDEQRLSDVSRRQWNQLLHVKTERKALFRSGNGYFAKPGDRQLIREALVLTAAKHGLAAAQQLKSRLSGRPNQEQIEKARQVVQDLDATPPKQTHRYYNPFRVTQDQNLLGNRSRFEHKLHFISHDSRSIGKPLKDVKPNQVLVIDGHGGTNLRGTIGTIAPGGQSLAESLTAEQLADRLIKDGLSKDHQVIRMSNCFAGGLPLKSDHNDRNAYRDSLRHNQQEVGVCFASQLAAALGRRGFDNIVVGGYPGTVHVLNKSDPATIMVYSGGSQRMIPAQGLCNYFDPNGQLTDNPRNPNKPRDLESRNRIIQQRME